MDLETKVRELESNTAYWTFSREQFKDSCDRAHERIQKSVSDPFETREVRLRILEFWRRQVLQNPGYEKYEIACRSQNLIVALGLDGWTIVLESGFDPTIHPPPCDSTWGWVYNSGILSICGITEFEVDGFYIPDIPGCDPNIFFDSSEDTMYAQMQYVLNFKRGNNTSDARYVECLNSALNLVISNGRFKICQLLIQYGANVNDMEKVGGLFSFVTRTLNFPDESKQRKLDFMLDNGLYFQQKLDSCNHYGSYYYGVVSGAHDPNSRCTTKKDEYVPNCMARRPDIKDFLLEMFRLIKRGYFINPVCFPESIKKQVDELQWALLVKQTNLPIPVEILVYRVIYYL